MSKRLFSLVPFPGSDISDITIRGNISRQNNLLSLHYSLRGNISQVFLPSKAAHPGRRDELWKRTCFEFFLAIKDQPEYWEFNMSPSGDWNIYYMEAYRRVGFQEEHRLSQLPFEIKDQIEQYSMDVSVDISSIIRPEQELQVAITAILQAKDGMETYWALAHPAPRPDFHLRKSFTLELAGQIRPAQQPAPAD